jgi:hypothetical protein
MTGSASTRALRASLVAAAVLVTGIQPASAQRRARVRVEVQPPSATVVAGETFAFTATVTGASDTSVVWSVAPQGCGAIDAAGRYTAPGAPASCEVRATSAADRRRRDAASVAVVAASGGGTAEPPPAPPASPVSATLQVRLVPQGGVSGVQRVNFGLPVPPGVLRDAGLARVAPAGGAELPAARRVLATWPDGSIRALQLQVDVDVGAVAALDVQLGEASAAGTLPLADVATTLAAPDGTSGPRVWAVLPASWLAPSEVAGPVVEAGAVAGTALGGWVERCDHARWGVDAFLAARSDRGAWLFDRPTALYRGYAADGSADTLESAYREAAIYRAGLTGTGSSTRIGVPGAADDLKYHYTQGMAIHYLLTGDDRFREGAEDVAIRAHDLWADPGYAGGSDFWTERHAGFALLAYEWAAAVSDDRAPTFAAWADEAVSAYLPMQDVAANAWEEDARCFAHSAAAHGEGFGYVGCSPWMSAILADGLDAYARRAGGDRAAAARGALVRLGRMIARHGLDAGGKPYYWMGAGVDAAEADDYDEHWGEAAYVVAMAWHWGGRADAALRAAADALAEGFRARGEVGQLRSYNWQCRSGPLAPGYLR